MKEKARINYTEPKWVKEEGKRLMEGWLKSDDDDLEHYCRTHGSKHFIKEMDMVLAL